VSIYDPQEFLDSPKYNNISILEVEQSRIVDISNGAEDFNLMKERENTKIIISLFYTAFFLSKLFLKWKGNERKIDVYFVCLSSLIII
jgi:hypothetical protein